MIRIYISLLFCIAMVKASAQDFNKFFTDETLRIDYIFAGNAAEQHIFVDKLNRIDGWHGKRFNLSQVPVEGNGQIVMKDCITGETIYRNSFSTLFQEWLSYDEAVSNSRSFENVFLTPMPKQKANVTVTLFNNRRETVCTLTHTVDPEDILIRTIGQRHAPYDVLIKPKDKNRAVRIAFVAEGYTKSEMKTFIQDCKIACQAMFSHEPFKGLKDKFQVIAVKTESAESGTSEPSNGIWRETILGSHFDTFYSDRYLTTLNLKSLHDAIAGTPYEHIIVLVNTEKYGGGGILNSYNLSMAHHRNFQPVVVHEFGHSFAGLADEYSYESEQIPMYPHDIEPWEQNITTLVDFPSKWQDMKDDGVAGLYEGAGYSMKGVYRPFEDCRMRTNENPEFCEVCKRAITRVIQFYTEP